MNALYFIGLCLIWGTTWMAIKINLASFPPFYSAGLRFLLAGFIMAALMLITGRRLPKERKEIYPSLVFGLLNGVSYGLVYWGEQFISSGLTAILNASLPFFSLIFAYFYVGEKVTLQKVTGSLIGFGGVMVLFSEALSGIGGTKVIGQLAIIAAAAVYAFAGVYMKKKSQLEPISAATVQMFLSALVLMAVAVVSEHVVDIRWTLSGTLAFLYLSIFGSAIAFYLYNQLVLRIEISKVSFVSLITPAIATITGVIMLHESLQWQTLMGMLLIFIGIFVINMKLHSPTNSLESVENAK